MRMISDVHTLIIPTVTEQLLWNTTLTTSETSSPVLQMLEQNELSPDMMIIRRSSNLIRKPSLIHHLVWTSNTSSRYLPYFLSFFLCFLLTLHLISKKSESLLWFFSQVLEVFLQHQQLLLWKRMVENSPSTLKILPTLIVRREMFLLDLVIPLEMVIFWKNVRVSVQS